MPKCQPSYQAAQPSFRISRTPTLFCLWILLPGLLSAQKIATIKPERFFSVDVPSPQSITFDIRLKRYYLTGDRGRVYSFNQQWMPIRSSEREGSDYQAICAHEKVVYVRDAGAKKVVAYDAGTLLPQYTFELPVTVQSTSSGSGFTWNQARKSFVLTAGMQNKKLILAEFDTDFRQIHEHRQPIASLSALTWFDGALWGFSSGERMLYRIHPDTYNVMRSWRVKTKKIRSICFDKEGNLFMLRDDKPLVYEFRTPRSQP
ncbi:MAG: hypothetical protein FJ344_06935 [Sphingomonadales bacterium]|nr:hypothetical protein [Sphingomonadales bacterium]